MQHEPAIADRGTDGKAGAAPIGTALSRRMSALRRTLPALDARLAADVSAGLLAAVLLTAFSLSYSALLLQGELSVGLPALLWGMLLGTCLVGIWVGLATTLPPLASGSDGPTMAVLVILGATTAADVLAGGDSAETAVRHVLIVLSVTTVISGLLMLVLGHYRLGGLCRFVPYCVVGGFLGATGCLLLINGMKLATAKPLALTSPAAVIGMLANAKVLVALAVALLIWLVRARIKSAFALPLTLILIVLAVNLVLLRRGLSGPEHGWYVTAATATRPWTPLQEMLAADINWRLVAGHVPDILAATGVIVLSLIVKISSFEVMRATQADLDSEFRANGAVNLVAAAFGGIASSLLVSATRLLTEAGAATRNAGVAAGVAVGLVLASGIDLPGMVPIPVLAGMILYVGYGSLIDSLRRPFAQRAWLDLFLALAIMIVCVRYGYIIGIVAGLVCACLLFAISYGRIGVVRRHVTRRSFASNVDRSLEAEQILRRDGDAIQLYWLSGYLFFGSSDGVFERVRADIEALEPGRVRFVILDFAAVSGADSSAVMSLIKLKGYCDKAGVTLVFSALSPASRNALEQDGFFGAQSRHRAAPDRNTALAWCESRILEGAPQETGSSPAQFLAWIDRQIGPAGNGRLLSYLERRDVAGGQVLYRQGEVADTIDLVANGELVIELEQANGARTRVRRIATHTVVGEMGFFRRTERMASISAAGAAEVYTLKRASFERMQQEEPALAAAFDAFIIRVLADRLEFAGREVAALSA